MLFHWRRSLSCRDYPKCAAEQGKSHLQGAPLCAIFPRMEQGITAARRYSLGAIAFHWIIALLILLNFLGAWESHDLPPAEKAYAMAGHKAFGMTILTLSVLRLLWRLTHRAPPLLETLKSWEAALAKVTHWLFYFLMIAIPSAGWAMHSAFSGGKPVSFFGLFAFPGLPLAQDKEMAGLFHELHESLATLMLFLLALHVAAALKHQFYDHDGTFRRMLPGRN
jgi:cytochrome b561